MKWIIALDNRQNDWNDTRYKALMQELVFLGADLLGATGLCLEFLSVEGPDDLDERITDASIRIYPDSKATPCS